MTIAAELHDGTKLEFPDGTNTDVIQSVVKRHLSGESHPIAEKDTPITEQIVNGFRGASARGNQAMNALNPFASQESKDKIAREQEWVKQNKGAGVGSVLADMAITAPAGGPAGAGARALADTWRRYCPQEQRSITRRYWCRDR